MARVFPGTSSQQLSPSLAMLGSKELEIKKLKIMDRLAGKIEKISAILAVAIVLSVIMWRDVIL